MPRRGPAPPGSDSDVEAAIPARPWPGEQPLPPELLADSRGAAYTAACALQESSRENDALCAPWPVPWATLVQAQGHDGSAATLERELDAAMVEPAQRTEMGGVPPSQIERVRACGAREHLPSGALVSPLTPFPLRPAGVRQRAEVSPSHVAPVPAAPGQRWGRGAGTPGGQGPRPGAQVAGCVSQVGSQGWLNACVLTPCRVWLGPTDDFGEEQVHLTAAAKTAARAAAKAAKAAKAAARGAQGAATDAQP